MRSIITDWVKANQKVAFAALLAAASAPLPAAAQTGYALMAGSVDYHLSTFQATAPGTFTATVTITGLGTGQALVGIDARPATGQLFALGYTVSSQQAQLYVLNPTTGALTAVGGPLALALGTNAARIGFDFNPTVDRIRVTAANGGNFRLNPNTGALAATDGALAYAATDPNAGQTPGVGSSAYTNSFLGATATTLYNLDETAGRLVIQNPPNNGTLNTVGPLGTAINSSLQTSDLDVYFDSATSAQEAYLSVSSFSTSSLAFSSMLYTVNLATGATTARGALGNNTGEGVADIAFATTRVVPATVTGQLAYALAGTNLITFDTALPRIIRTAVGISGVDAAQTLVGLDIRPATNSLYALGYNAAAQTYQLYALNAQTGTATAVNAAPIALALGAGKVSFDFNPVVDRIRVVGANRGNFRLNPNDGTVAATDTPLAYATGDPNAAATPSIGAVAYTNSVVGAPAATTTLYDYDLGLSVLATQNPPNNGTLNTVGPTGLMLNATAPGLDLDIYSSAAGTNTGYLVGNPGAGSLTVLWTINLATGNATLIGEVGTGIVARDIAIAPASGVVTAVKSAKEANGMALYPNPLADAATLGFTLPRAGRVELVVSDARGRVVERIDAGLLPTGPHALRWNRKGQAAGMYFFQLRLDGQPAGVRQGVLGE